ncbi:MAG: PqqD family peptide modification chaperone [Sumerlaeia bacterium]
MISSPLKVISDPVDPWVILVHSTYPRSLVTTAVGARISQLVWGENTVESIAETIQQEFDSPSRSQILDDIQFTLQQLHNSGLHPTSPTPRISAKKADPESLTIYVTGQCNLRCKHCAIVEGKMPVDRITTADMLRIISAYAEHVPDGTITFLGGEPFMHADILPLLEHACALVRGVVISTNGTFITNEIAARVSKLQNLSLQVSLDGANQEIHDFIRGKNSYESTWKAIKLFSSLMGERLVVATTLTKASVKQVQELIAQCDEHKISTLRFINLNKLKSALVHWEQISPDPEVLKTTLRYLIFEAPQRPNGYTRIFAGIPGFVPNRNETQDHWCPLGKMMLVTAQGEAYNCPIMETPDTEVTASFLGPSTPAFTGIEKNQRSRNWMKSRQHEVSECQACAWRSYCGGGCTAFMALRSGDVRQNDEFCTFRRNLYREYFLRKQGLSVESLPEL